MSDYKSFTSRQEADVCILELTDVKLSLLESIERVRDEATDFFAATAPKSVVINFRKVQFAGSDAIGVFIALRKQLAEQGGTINLCCMTENTRLTFQVLNLIGTLFEIYETEAEAIAALT